MDSVTCSIVQLKRFSESTLEEIKLHKKISRHLMYVTPYYKSVIDWNDPNDSMRRMAIFLLESIDNELGKAGVYFFGDIPFEELFPLKTIFIGGGNH